MDQKVVSVLVAAAIMIATALLGQECSGTGSMQWGALLVVKSREVNTS